MVALLPASQTDLEDNALSAYNVCLEFEAEAKDQDIIHARLLGYLILHAPSLAARHEVVKEIHRCSHDYSSLAKLGEYFINYFIRAFKRGKGRTPASSDHSSRPSDVDKKSLMEKIREAPKNHRDAKARALIRDGSRCVVTGKYDLDSDVPEEDLRRTGGGVYTECAYILPESTYSCTSTTDQAGSSAKEEYSASVLAVLTRFGYDVNHLNGPKVHSLYNVMTMQKDVHDWFDRLEMWFEATGIQDCYRVRTAKILLFPEPDKITFKSSYPDILPVPSPELLALHAAAAKVAHLSGAGAYIDRIDRDLDDSDVLAPDGGSSDVLSHALWRSLGAVSGV